MALFAHNICRRLLFTPAPVLKLQKPKKHVVIKSWPFMTNAIKVAQSQKVIQPGSFLNQDTVS